MRILHFISTCNFILIWNCHFSLSISFPVKKKSSPTLLKHPVLRCLYCLPFPPVGNLHREVSRCCDDQQWAVGGGLCESGPQQRRPGTSSGLLSRASLQWIHLSCGRHEEFCGGEEKRMRWVWSDKGSVLFYFVYFYLFFYIYIIVLLSELLIVSSPQPRTKLKF